MGIANFTGPSQSGVTEPTTDIQGILNVTKVKGRHTVKTGFNIDNFRNLSDNLNQNSLSFSPLVTADPQNKAGTGSGLASFLLGLPDSGQRSLGNTSYYGRWSLYQFHLQDDLKLTKRLTLNLGLRYEWDQWPRDAHGKNSMFDRTSNQFVWSSKNPVTGQAANIRDTIRDPDMNNFAPRIGLAYQFSSNTTVRAGYSIFYATDYEWEIQGPRGQWPYALGENPSGVNTSVTPDKLQPVQTFFPAYTDVVPGTPPSAVFAIGRLDRTSYIQQWNLGVQRQLARDLMLEVNYVGTKGTKMPTFVFTNFPLPGPGVIGSAQHPRPWPQQRSFIIEADDWSDTIYHGLQAKLEKRFSNGLQLLTSYAWAHYIDDGGGGNTSANFPPNDRNLGADRANGPFDFRHIFTASYVYQLPFGHGKRFLPDTSGVVNQIVGGWEVSGITHYNSGAPYNVTLTFDNANVGFGSQRPNRVGPSSTLINPNDRTQGWINPAAFSVPAQYTFGNSGRNTERGPGFGNWDLALLKNFPLHQEKQSLQFRTEFFNAFNNVSLGNPNAGFCTPLPKCNPSFGRIFGTQSTERQIQFALKFIF
jgi:hypothetical protein